MLLLLLLLLWLLKCYLDQLTGWMPACLSPGGAYPSSQSTPSLTTLAPLGREHKIDLKVYPRSWYCFPRCQNVITNISMMYTLTTAYILQQSSPCTDVHSCSIIECISHTHQGRIKRSAAQCALAHTHTHTWYHMEGMIRSLTTVQFINISVQPSPLCLLTWWGDLISRGALENR